MLINENTETLALGHPWIPSGAVSGTEPENQPWTLSSRSGEMHKSSENTVAAGLPPDSLCWHAHSCDQQLQDHRWQWIRLEASIPLSDCNSQQTDLSASSLPSPIPSLHTTSDCSDPHLIMSPLQSFVGSHSSPHWSPHFLRLLGEWMRNNLLCVKAVLWQPA